MKTASQSLDYEPGTYHVNRSGNVVYVCLCGETTIQKKNKDNQITCQACKETVKMGGEQSEG